MWASFNRRVIASGVIFDCCFLGGGGRAFWGWPGAIQDCNDDNQSNCIHSSKLGMICVFGYAAEAIGCCDGDSVFRSLLSIKFKLDFHSHLHWRSQIIDDNLVYRRAVMVVIKLRLFMREQGAPTLHLSGVGVLCEPDCQRFVHQWESGDLQDQHHLYYF